MEGGNSLAGLHVIVHLSFNKGLLQLLLQAPPSSKQKLYSCRCIVIHDGLQVFPYEMEAATIQISQGFD